MRGLLSIVEIKQQAQRGWQIIVADFLNLKIKSLMREKTFFALCLRSRSVKNIIRYTTTSPFCISSIYFVGAVYDEGMDMLEQ